MAPFQRSRQCLTKVFITSGFLDIVASNCVNKDVTLPLKMSPRSKVNMTKYSLDNVKGMNKDSVYKLPSVYQESVL